ncbi:hypothetical protein DGMP_20960 [Desulfomarina profundi]|uniref:Zinc-binding protein n=1 Tax=Desulfomarina profundi TaxID=2772557 RepID=A0A8D5FLV5_9BACT|nr:putative zinc-binding protein [Desulfomarina profundi]BCL61403.1 hypothetical protein DGMP_20960 [Desulfomarina profundi]
MKKKLISQINNPDAADTITNQHKKFGKTIGVNGCFGSSNIGQMTGFIARKIVSEIPSAFMRCPIGLYPEVEGPSQVMLYDDYQVVIDGCKGKCLGLTCEKAGLSMDLYYTLDDNFSLKKKPGPDFDEQKMNEIADLIIKDIRKMTDA